MKCKHCQVEILSDAYFCIHCDHFIPAPERGEKAGLFARFVAACIDPLIGLLLYLLAVSLFAGISADSGATAAVVFPFAYFIWFLTLLRRGKTPGKLLLGLQVVNHRHGEIPGFLRMFVREIIGKFVSGLFLGLGYFWAIFDRNGQAWHDKIAGTVVLKVPRVSLGVTAPNTEISTNYLEVPLSEKREAEPLTTASVEPLSTFEVVAPTRSGDPSELGVHEASRSAPGQSPFPLESSLDGLGLEPAGSPASKVTTNDTDKRVPPPTGFQVHDAHPWGKELGTQLTSILKAAIGYPALLVGAAAFLAGGLAVYLFHIRSEATLESVETASTRSQEQGLEREDTVRELSERLARLEEEHQQESVKEPLSASSSEELKVVEPPTRAKSQEHFEEAPLITVGDRYVYETLDLDNPQMNNVTERTITGHSGGVYEQRNLNQKSGYTRILEFDRYWNLVSSGLPTGRQQAYQPYLKYFDFPLYVGKTWSGNSIETTIKTGKTREHILRGQVADREKITVPAGTFDTFKIILDTELLDGAKRTYGRDVSWYAPAARRTVRSEIESRDPDTGKTEKRIVQLLSLELR